MTAERANFHVGISTDIIFPSLKQQLLLFDRIAVVELQWRITLCKLFAMMFPEDADSHLSEANDLEYLSGLGLVYDPGTPSSYVEQQSKSGYEKEDLANLQEVIRWGELAAETRSVFSDVMDRVKKHGQVFDASTADIDRLTKTLRKYILEKNAEHYFTAKLLSKKLQSVDGLNATPLSANPRTLPKDALLQKSGSVEKVTIVQLVLDKLPPPK